MTTTSPRGRPRMRRRHWSLGLVVLVLVVLALAYDQLSAPTATQIGACRIVPAASPAHHSECDHVDLSGRDLAGRDLRLADLRGADLRGADLRGAILYGADLSRTDLRGADLRDADLTQADLTDARLDDTDFTDAGISGMNVTGTVLAASQYSEWVDSDDPQLVTVTAGTQPGIIVNTCASLQGLYYPGQSSVNCTLATGAEYDGTLSYARTVELKRPPVISAPSEVRLRVGQRVDLHLAADSPFPAVQTSFSGPLPAGLSWDTATQRLTGVPSASAVGSTTRQFVADNGMQATAPVTFVVAR
jgi:hypothetical protein